MTDQPNDQRRPRVLVVDDESNIRFLICEILRRENFNSIQAENGEQALQVLEKDHIDLVIMDIRMPVMDGMTALRKIGETYPDQLVIMITAHGTEKLAHEAIEAGAYDFFTKPFDVNEVRIVIRRALDKVKMRQQLLEMERLNESRYSFENIVGQSQAMRDVFDLIERVADTDVTVLINGESGTGKEMIASAIHHHSSRKPNPFIKINTVAIPESLLESEMFGHEKGSFTGAVATKIGKFEAAESGTLFLDEIGDMPMMLQAKLLRVLQEHQIERVGSTKTIDVDIRVVCATHRNLSDGVRDKTFREDLFYRINVMPIFIPPLRERKEDIPLLINYFIEHYAPRFARPVETIDQEALELCLKYQWPGNVRELENILQRSILMAEGPAITVKDLSPIIKGLKAPSPAATRTSFESEEFANPLLELDLSKLLDTDDFSLPLSDRLSKLSEHVEVFLIKAALIKANQHRQETADLLGISRKSLHNKMVRYGLMTETKGGITQFD